MTTLGLAPTYLDTKKRAPQAQNFFDELRKRIIAQDEAIEALADVYQTCVAGINMPGRPLGNFLLLGPTGTGKTRIVEAGAEIVLGSAAKVVKIDCAEFQHSHEIAKLIGSPPGYLGHRETHPLLSQAVIDQHHTDTTKVTFVLFDEIEKASDSLWNLLLGILDKATLTLGNNTRVDFSRCFVILTANLGSSEMAKAMHPMGFTTGEPQSKERKHKRNASIGTRAARGKFTAEFFNRLDRVVTFNPLDQVAIAKILEIELDQVQRLLNLRTPTGAPRLFFSPEAKALLTEQGFDETYGARHLKRAVHRLLTQPLANLIGSGQVKAGDFIQVDSGASQLLFSKA